MFSPSGSISLWTRRFLVALTILAWLAIGIVLFQALGYIAGSLILMIIAITLAYAIYPAVKFLQRFIPRPLAVLTAYLAILALLSALIYFVLRTAIVEFIALIQNLQKQTPQLLQQSQTLLQFLEGVGIKPEQLQSAGGELLNRALAFTDQLQLILFGFFTLVINLILITALSVYFVVDGHRPLRWLREKTPLPWRESISFFLDTIDQTMGGFIRGQILLATVITTIITIGLTILGVPYAILLAMVVFIFEFVPQIGSYISASIIILITFITKDWQTGLIVTVFCGVVQGGLDGQILAPRILGQSVGLHPIVSIFALVLGAQLFGAPGAFFAAPAAGVIQIFARSAWSTWKKHRPDQFPEEYLERHKAKTQSAQEASTSEISSQHPTPEPERRGVEGTP